jgi:N-acetylmuramic acid 6-phosphate etherase
MTLLIGVDLGKTRCRVQVSRESRSLSVVEGPGARGLADPGGVEAARAAIESAVRRACEEARLSADALVDAVAVGAAGSEAAKAAGATLMDELARRLRTRSLALTTDSVISHVGALRGEHGAMIAMGTGAVAVGVGRAGYVQVDGMGYWLGDDGGGSWIGRAGLRAALLARDGRAARTRLLAAAEERFGDLGVLPFTLASGGNIAAATAAFTPEVVRCADLGDEQAKEILIGAGQALADTVASAARASGTDRVTAIGGLTSIDVLMESWRSRLPDSVVVVQAGGSALDGAVLLAGNAALPHEARVVRLDVRGRGGGDAATDDVDRLETEQVRPDLFDLDRRSPDALVDILLEAESAVPAAVVEARAAIAAAVVLVEKALGAGGRLVYVGAGTPGRLAALDAAECPPTFAIGSDRVVAVLAGGGEAATTAVEGAEDSGDAGRADVLALDVGPCDVVVGIASSGRTPYVVAALEAAHAKGARTVGVVNNADSALSRVVDVTIELLTGPEVLAGSTRLKAGTSQKVVLNIISTAAMVRLGKTYGPWMVDVQASNEKLRRRARRLLREAAGVSDGEAANMLAQAGGRTKTALVALLASVDVETAQTLLDAAGGRVREAVRSAVASREAGP